MKIRRKEDGRVFEWEAVHFGRGEWATNLVKVDGDMVSLGMGDPAYTTERAARQAARMMTRHMVYIRGLGWCYDPDSFMVERMRGTEI